MPWNDNLTVEQSRAASHHGKHGRLLAGPGTGKTFCLTRRILYLIEERDVSADEIMALTFTRAAAKELRTRVQGQLGDNARIPYIATLHSFALKTILTESAGTRLPQPIRVADDFEERQIVVEDLKTILDVRKVSEVSDLLNKLSADWETLTADQDGWPQRFPHARFVGAWQEHRRVYGYVLRAELVFQLWHAFQEAEISAPSGTKHLLVDEYQDLNPCDLSLIKKMTVEDIELFAAGDDDQSIYGFRYANPDGIRRFTSEFIPSDSLTLEECRRCDRDVLEIAHYIADQDPRRVPKNLRCLDSSGNGEVRLLQFVNQDAESQGIAKIAKWLVDREAISPKEVLVLIRADRNHLFSSLIRESLMSEDLNTNTVANPFAPLEEPEGRRLLCLLRLAHNELDSLSIRTLLQIGDYHIGAKTFEALYELARTTGETFAASVIRVAADATLCPRIGQRISQAYSEISQALSRITARDSADLAQFLESAVRDCVSDDVKREKIAALFDQQIQSEPAANLEQFLRSIAASQQTLEQDIEEDCINIMTMHQAKGLSADAVFVVAAEDEYLPGRAESSLDDERRLLYVSLTRARHFLYVSHCRERWGPQRHSGRNSGRKRRTLTRFLSGGPLRSEPGSAFVAGLNSED